MKLKIIVGVFAILLLGGTVAPVLAQTESLADHVVINEVEVNPPGLDTGSPIEWVELHNPTDDPVDISGWKISSSPSADRTYSIPSGTIILPGEFLIFFYTSAWFTDVAEVVELLDDQGNLIDKTPFLTDIANDNTSWQRKTDGFDTNADGDWINKFSTPGKTIGKEIRAIQQASDLAISVSSDKDAYVFGETARILGEVSRKAYIEKPTFITDTIDMKITGPGGFVRDLTLYPDYNLNFRTTLKLDTVLEIREGVYDVFVEYGGVTDFTQFRVGHQESIIVPTTISLLSVTTDEISYIPNQRITITAHSTELIPFEPLKYKVQDPSGAVAIEGSVFPNQEELSRYMKTNRFAKGGTAELNPASQFITRGLIDPIAPVYGTYLVTVEYGTNTARTTFELTAEKFEDTLISLITDKPAYGLGETVTISGRLNGFWIPSLDLEIAQSGILSLQGARGQPGDAKLFKQTNAVTLKGDSTFEYQYTIPRTANALGDWRVMVHKNIGTEVTFFKVVENPDEYFDDSSEIFFVSTDKEVYDINETVNIFGRINDIQYAPDRITNVVKLEIKSEGGLSILNPTHKPTGNKPLGSVFEKTSIPDDSGVFKVKEPLYRAKYAAGNYIVKASYDLPSVSKGSRTGDTSSSLFTDTTKFTVRDTLYEEGITVKLNKSIYGLGEEVKLTGTYPQSAQGVGIKIKLEQPNGKTREFGTLVDDGRFSWKWTTPIAEKTNRVENERAALVSTTAVTSSNYGTYKLTVGTDSGSRTVFFKVSPNPEEDFVSLEPITVSTDKSVYKTSEKVRITGNAQRVEQGKEGLVIPYRVEIKVETEGFPTSSFKLHALPSDKNLGGSDFPIKRLKSTEAYLDNGGNFKATIDLPPTVFIGGTYKVSAIYQGQRAQTTFDVENDFVIKESIDLVRTSPKMVISTDKEEYERGETVYITTRPDKNIFLEKVKVAIPSEESRKINCGAFVCGPGAKVTELRPDERTATFYHEQKIPVFGTAAGAGFQSAGTEKNPRPMPDKETYFVAIEAEFGTFTKPITVWNIPKPVVGPSTLEERITEKFNRITESHIDIDIDEKIIDGEEFEPRVLQGSLFTPNRGQESEVNVRVVTQSGVCLIGPDPDCTVRESTRAPGAIYQKVMADGKEYKVRYSGHEAKLEKFTILPVDPDGTLPDMDWDVDVQKEDQSSHFYYKVTYVEDKETI